MTTYTGAQQRPHPRSGRAADREALPDVLALVGFILLCQGVGLVGAAVGGDASEMYRRLALPDWAPPSSVFGPVWVVLYTLIGTAAWLVWRTGKGAQRREAMLWFGLQLAVNALWTPVFFGKGSLGGGFFVLLLLMPLITGMLIAFGKRSPVAAALVVPYWLWSGFALVLNGAIVWLA